MDTDVSIVDDSETRGKILYIHSFGYRFVLHTSILFLIVTLTIVMTGNIGGVILYFVCILLAPISADGRGAWVIRKTHDGETIYIAFEK